jgi:outer membrane lipoprotein LolB
VRGPLGAGGLRVLTDGDVLLLNDPSGRTLDGPAARDELERRLGVALPLAEMRYWMLGVPAPGAVEEAGVGAEAAFTQNGWQVRLESTRTVGPWQLPARLTATARDVRVRIVVDDWQLAAAP